MIPYFHLPYLHFLISMHTRLFWMERMNICTYLLTIYYNISNIDIQKMKLKFFWAKYNIS